MALRTVAEALEALSHLTNYERTKPPGMRAFDLSRPTALLERIGSPHLRLGTRVIQVAGTKGKGSTTRFLESICRAAGLRTGRFCCPLRRGSWRRAREVPRLSASTAQSG